MNTKTKKDLVKVVADRTGLDINTVRNNIQCIFEIMCEGLERDGNIEVRNFGIFKVKTIEKRQARNPKTGETIEVPRKNLIHFKPGQLMKKRINGIPIIMPREKVEEQMVAQQPQPPQPESPPVEPKPARPKAASREGKQPSPIILMTNPQRR